VVGGHFRVRRVAWSRRLGRVTVGARPRRIDGRPQMSALGDAFEHGASAAVGHAEERRGGRPWIPADKRGPKFSGL
ncbi:hypothetical protein IscW_ISCW007856, partial [Ixodes scapularis]